MQPTQLTYQNQIEVFIISCRKDNVASSSICIYIAVLMMERHPNVVSQISAIFICIWSVCYAQNVPPRPVVVFKSGSVRGLTYAIPFGYVVDKFLGIPYAAPPVGNLRFSAPQPETPWEGVKEATEFPTKCPQNSVPFPWNVTVGKECMTLNN